MKLRLRSRSTGKDSTSRDVGRVLLKRADGHVSLRKPGVLDIPPVWLRLPCWPSGLMFSLHNSRDSTSSSFPERDEASAFSMISVTCHAVRASVRGGWVPSRMHRAHNWCEFSAG